ncbi:methylase involved in ubiquinone/menaquinone biosynthesis [Caulobacter sp. AP07]|uniref:class I SAM-dependent methyltransferase n=1 Tax=Caulobacter sp. AP07 TaxID=1144304 RepID=UPI00027201E3|nr:class I SAM-dependent methyltransferase [Caulobacter sp. AP07]EJL25372.1 methylase involved in ubiquinone/menaquinone biosynthesis [Caulobacter sp. AP07]
MSIPPFWAAAVSSYDQYLGFLNYMGAEIHRRDDFELSLIEPTEPFFVPGACGICKRTTSFRVTFAHASPRESGQLVPNWREHLNCQHCGLNNRMRAAIQFLQDVMHGDASSHIYMTEQITPMYSYLKDRYPNMIGSEFLHDGTQPGRYNKAGVRFEDLTRLSFQDDTFDGVLSFDVLEHVPDYRKGLAEVYRCLKPGGKFLFTAPFDVNDPNTVIRATMDSDGKIEHLMEPEYHGDPLTDQGVLCFQRFGWDVLTSMEEIGFKGAQLHFYWSAELGYLGPMQFVVLAEK